MKKSIFIALLLTLFAGSAMALTKGEVMKCTGQLHACFGANYKGLVDLNPTSSDECLNACASDLSNGHCSIQECTSRCNVAFEIDAVNMCN